jgi:hypothetical protein
MKKILAKGLCGIELPLLWTAGAIQLTGKAVNYPFEFAASLVQALGWGLETLAEKLDN